MREKAGRNPSGERWKTNVSEPSSMCRNCRDAIETRLQPLAWDESGGWPVCGPDGGRHRDGVSPAQALVRNVGTCTPMPRETSKRLTREEPSTDAGCRGGRARGSDEARAAPAEVPLHTPHPPLQDLAHLACPQMGKGLPGELSAVLVPGPVQDDEVEVRVEAQVGRRPLHHGDGAAFGPGPTLLSRPRGVEGQHCLHHQAREPAQDSRAPPPASATPSRPTARRATTMPCSPSRARPKS